MKIKFWSSLAFTLVAFVVSPWASAAALNVDLPDNVTLAWINAAENGAEVFNSGWKYDFLNGDGDVIASVQATNATVLEEVLQQISDNLGGQAAETVRVRAFAAVVPESGMAVLFSIGLAGVLLRKKKQSTADV